MFKLIKIHVGITETILNNCITEKRGIEFLNICNSENSTPLKTIYKVVRC